MKNIITFIIALLLSSGYVYAQEVGTLGVWSGDLSFGPNKIGIIFNIKQSADGKVLCTMDVPAQSAKDIPVKILQNSNDSLNLSIEILKAEYKGRKVSSKSIEGIFSQNGANLELKLKPGEVELKRPQTPKEPFQYRTEEVTFNNNKEGAVLAGTLTYPIGFEKAKEGTVPVVIMIAGSGMLDRNEEIHGHKPFLVIADYLAKNGIATLRYDHRGVGKSTGSILGLTSLNFLTDSEAGISYLRSLKKFGKIGVLGHSEGGTIAFMMGAKKSVDFIISLAGAAADGIDIIIGQNRAIFKQQGIPQNTIDDYITALKVVYKDRIAGNSIEDGQQYIDNICNENSLSLNDYLKTNLTKCITAGGEGFTFFLKSTPSKYIAKTSCPVMALNGTLDLQVLSSDNIPVIEKNLPKNKKHIIKVYDSLNHLFQHCTLDTSLSYATIDETISEEVMKDIAEWINQ